MALGPLDLKLNSTTTQEPSDKAVGTIVSQKPAAGQEVPAATEVSIVVSSGPASTLVPDLVGMDQDAALALLTQRKLKGLDPAARQRPPGGRGCRPEPEGRRQSGRGLHRHHLGEQRLRHAQGDGGRCGRQEKGSGGGYPHQGWVQSGSGRTAPTPSPSPGPSWTRFRQRAPRWTKGARLRSTWRWSRPLEPPRRSPAYHHVASAHGVGRQGWAFRGERAPHPFRARRA